MFILLTLLIKPVKAKLNIVSFVIFCIYLLLFFGWEKCCDNFVRSAAVIQKKIIEVCCKQSALCSFLREYWRDLRQKQSRGSIIR